MEKLRYKSRNATAASIKQGHLLKRIFPSIWSKHFCVLVSPKSLFCFRKQKDKSPEGIIQLDDCVILPCEYAANKPNAFKICHPKRKTVYFQATSKLEQLVWIKMLRSQIEGNNAPDLDLLDLDESETATIHFSEAEELGKDWTDLGPFENITDKGIDPAQGDTKLRSSFSPIKLQLLYYQYKDPREKGIGPLGLERLSKALGVEPDDVSMILLSWHLGISNIGKLVSEEDFMREMCKLELDTIPTIKIRLEKLKTEFINSDTFFYQIYIFSFKYASEPESQVLDIGLAAILFSSLMSDKYETSKFCKYLEKQRSYHVIRFDQWMSFYDFFHHVAADLSNYNVEQSRWPTILDEYVATYSGQTTLRKKSIL